MILDKVKMALRITTDAYDSELTDLISSALLDLGITDIAAYALANPDSLVETAVKTYCKMHFGEPEEYDRLKRSYDEQKGQLATSSDYTDWGHIDV